MSTSQAFRFDLDGSASESPVPAPRDDGTIWWRSILTSTRDHLLTVQQAPTGDGDYGVHLRPAALDGTTAGERIAIAVRSNPGECVAAFPVYLLTMEGGMTPTDMSAAEPPGYVPQVAGGVTVNDLWWNPDGHLYATIASWTCDETKRAEN